MSIMHPESLFLLSLIFSNNFHSFFLLLYILEYIFKSIFEINNSVFCPSIYFYSFWIVFISETIFISLILHVKTECSDNHSKHSVKKEPASTCEPSLLKIHINLCFHLKPHQHQHQYHHPTHTPRVTPRSPKAIGFAQS